MGHSVGGLIARAYHGQFPDDVAVAVLVDSTDEDTTLNLKGKLVHVRETATGKSVPPVQTIESSSPKPPTKAEIDEWESMTKLFGPPTIDPPFDKLPPDVQKLASGFVRIRNHGHER